MAARLALALSVLLLGFLPYDHEIAGDCRIVPAAERGIRAPLGDEITDILVSEGDWVEAGTVVVRLSGRDVRADLASTEAELARARADLEEVEAGPRRQEIERAKHQVQLLRNELGFHELQLRRQIELSGQGTTSENEVDQARRMRDAATQATAAAEAALLKLRRGSRDEEVRAARAQVAHFEALLEKHRRDLALTELRAPISGRVVTPHVRARVGQRAAKGDLIMVLHDSSHLGVSISADEEAAARVREGTAVKVRLRAVDGALVQGRVQGVAEAVETRSRTDTAAVRSDRELFVDQTLDRDPGKSLRILATLDDPGRRLVPGMTGKARIVVGPSFFWAALSRRVVGFLRTEAWSWLP
jgi:HlyD family secretion protein